MKTPTPPVMFANILQQGTLAEDVFGATLLVLAAIPAAFFLLLTVLTPNPALCADASPDAADSVAPSHAQAETPAIRATPL
jgi:hypothetical protein